MDSGNHYQLRADAAIRDAIAEKECQPILFIGAGMSRRYFGAPNWHDALRFCLSLVNDGGHEYDYYMQRYSGDPIAIGTAISERMHEWAWSNGRSEFSEYYFKGGQSIDIFLKHLFAQNLIKLTPKTADAVASAMSNEIKLMKLVQPHAIITTNFDNFLESIFPGYEPIIGQQVIRYNMNSFGEIFKIHGDASDPASIVLTKDDYRNFNERKKYISAKLLTYFAEHPVFIFGYSLNDPNVTTILEDIGEIIANNDGLIPNIFYIIWNQDADTASSLPEEHIIASTSKKYRVRAIVTKDFGWIYKALSCEQHLKSINPRLVRALAARAFKLVRSDIPKGTVEVNYDVLELIAEKDEKLPNLLGITQASNANASHPFVLTQVAHRLGYKSWHKANDLINKIKKDTGKDIRSTDNIYHCRIKSGTNSTVRKWSWLAVQLLQKIKNGEKYTLEM